LKAILASLLAASGMRWNHEFQNYFTYPWLKNFLFSGKSGATRGITRASVSEVSHVDG
jgi:hypothetical protein